MPKKCGPKNMFSFKILEIFKRKDKFTNKSKFFILACFIRCFLNLTNPGLKEQWDSNSDCRAQIRLRQPLDHHISSFPIGVFYHYREEAMALKTLSMSKKSTSFYF